MNSVSYIHQDEDLNNHSRRATVRISSAGLPADPPTPPPTVSDGVKDSLEDFGGAAGTLVGGIISGIPNLIGELKNAKE